MADIKVGTKVDIIGKNLKGTVAYIGTTMFAPGKWIGVILDGPMGKNDGSVQGKRYFTCGENCGVFVRQQHIKASTVGEAKQPQTGIKPHSRLQRPRTSSPSLRSTAQEPKGPKLPVTAVSRPTEPAPERMPESTPISLIETPTEVTTGDDQEQKAKSMAREPLSSYSNSGISTAEYESLKAQVKDWKDKFETIRLKRQAEREKLKDLEKSKLQVHQLTEYKLRMSEQNQELLKQVRDAKKEAKEAIDSKERYMEEMSDVHEAIEMATLDKEMAEEKVESLQTEVESLTEKVEELQTDLEIMKAEVEGQEDGAPSNYQMKQLEEQNSRLKEALVRMRDLSSAEKMEHQNLEKQTEKKNKELDELRKKTEYLKNELENAESTIDELKEQVDIAMVAEEMVEELTDKNLKLEEKVVDYEEQIQDLETMNEMNEELQENARENEMELREEVDLARSRMRNAERKVEAGNETISDYQETINKFRKLVQDLQEANEELRLKSSEDLSVELEPKPQFDYQLKVIETKTAARAIDLELRKIEAQQARDHVQFLSMFVPDAFSKHGGDGDCVEVLLLAQRLSKKSELIERQVSDIFDVSSLPDDRETVIGHRGEQLTFASNLLCDLEDIRILMDRYESTLSHCSVDLFQKIGTLHSEMAPHERVLDYLLDQLRRDSLDETTPVSNLTKAIEFFRHLYGVHISKEPFVDYWKMLDDHIRQSTVVIQSIQVNALRLRYFLGNGNDRSDIFILLKDIKTASSDIAQFCKKLRRRMPQVSEQSGAKDLPTLLFSADVIAKIEKNCENLRVINSVLFNTVDACSASITPENNVATPKEMQEVFSLNCNKYYDISGDGHDVIRRAAGDIMVVMNSLVTSLQEGEFDTKEPRPVASPPVVRRAQKVKSDVSDSEGLASKLGDKDVAIQELRKSLKLKVSEIGEVRVKIGMLERKLEKSGKVEQEQLTRIKSENDNLKEEFKKKEREYDETLDTLQRDIDTLEYEKAELKQRLMAQSKRSIISDSNSSVANSMKMEAILAGATASQGMSPGSQIIVKDSPLLEQQIKSLHVALQQKRSENYRLQGKELLDRMNTLQPLCFPRKPVINSHSAEKHKLQMELSKLKNYVIGIACPRIVDVSKSAMGEHQVGSKSPAQQLMNEQLKLQIAREKAVELQIKASKLMARYEYRGQ